MAATKLSSFRQKNSAPYQPIERSGCQMIYTSRRSSEMTKYAANVFLAMQ
jgi:UDP-glucose 6-dehydrogenase